MIPSTGAMAAPAITVSSDIDRMVAVTRFVTSFLFIIIVELLQGDVPQLCQAGFTLLIYYIVRAKVRKTSVMQK